MTRARWVGLGCLCILEVGLAGPAGAAFIDTGSNLTGVIHGDVSWADYDNDGDLDLAVTGGGDPGLVAKIYRNDNGHFADIGAPLLPVIQSEVAWGDYDRDGDLDLVLIGYDLGSTPQTRLYRNDSGSFTDLGAAGLPGAANGAAAWGDYDNDGDLDLYLSGHGVSARVGAVFRNDGGTFTDIGAGLPALSVSCAAWGDYDNDRDLDLFVGGFDGSQYVARVYRNNGGTFTDLALGLPGAGEGDVAWIDYDNDHDLDLFYSGHQGGAASTHLFRNNGLVSFTEIMTGLPGASRGPAWGDFDNDGDLDVVLMPPVNANVPVRLYRNDGGGTFVDVGAGFPVLDDCTPAWGDFDNDGDLDLVIAGGFVGGTGQSTTLFRNTSVVANTPPSPPTVLGLETLCGQFVAMSWNLGTDAQTPALGLTYNLRVGTEPGGNDVYSSMASSGGVRRVPAAGANGPNTSAWFRLPGPGVYYWSVQAIDGAYAGSPWAPEQVISGFAVNGTREARYGAPIATQAVQTEFGDATLGQVDFANGSELDELYVVRDDCTIYLMLTGNLESNFNKLELFFDTEPGGQNRLRGNNANIDGNGLNRMGDDGTGNGLKFDTGFAPDHYLTVSGGDVGGGTYRLSAWFADLYTNGGGPGSYLGTTGAGSDGLLNGGTNPLGIRAAINNSNTGGVGAGAGAQSGAGVVTGIELTIPMEALGMPLGCFNLCAFVNGAGHDFVSNQVLGPFTPPQTLLGDPRRVDFNRFAGTQWATFCPGVPVTVEEPVTTTELVRITSVSPNPTRGSALVSFALPRTETATIEVFNVLGRRVRTLPAERLGPGRHQLVWSGSDDAGRPLPNGVYFVRLTAGEARNTRKVAVMR